MLVKNYRGLYNCARKRTLRSTNPLMVSLIDELYEDFQESFNDIDYKFTWDQFYVISRDREKYEQFINKLSTKRKALARFEKRVNQIYKIYFKVKKHRETIAEGRYSFQFISRDEVQVFESLYPFEAEEFKRGSVKPYLFFIIVLYLKFSKAKDDPKRFMNTILNDETNFAFPVEKELSEFDDKSVKKFMDTMFFKFYSYNYGEITHLTPFELYLIMLRNYFTFSDRNFKFHTKRI